MKKKKLWRRLTAGILTGVLLVSLTGGVLPVGAEIVEGLDIVADGQWTVSKRWNGGFGFDNQNVIVAADKNQDQIILYTPSYAQKTTGNTSAWYEFVINANGYITSAGGYNNAIPEDGAVVACYRTGANGQKMIANTGVGDVLLYKEYPDFTVYRPSADDKRSSRNNSTFSTPYSRVLKVTVGGSGITTGSTVWSTDVLVKRVGAGADANKAGKGYVVSVGGNNIAVPTGYFAITVSGQSVQSGGGSPYSMGQFAKEYWPIGTLINCGGNEIFSRHDDAAAVRAAKLLTGVTSTDVDENGATVSAVENCAISHVIEDAEKNFRLVDTARMRSLYANMKAIAENLAAGDEYLARKVATIYRGYDEILALSMEQRTVEYRAAWVSSLRESDLAKKNAQSMNAADDPAVYGMSAAEIDAAIEKEVKGLADLGYNTVMYEVFHNSCTVMPMNGAGYNGLSYAQNPYLIPEGMGGKNKSLQEPYDMLAKYLEVCHKYGIELHVWLQAFYVGYTRMGENPLQDSLFDLSVAKKIQDNPDKYENWLNKANNGDEFFGAAGDGAQQYFLNPGNAAVRQFLVNTCSYIWNTYDIDGFHLDYIRYPKTQDGKSFGYDVKTIEAFQNAYKLQHGSSITADTMKAESFFTDPEWTSFRAAYVTQFVKSLHDAMRQERPDMLLTTATCAEYYEAENYLMQRFQDWLDNDYIDMTFGMAYGENIVQSTFEEFMEKNQTNSDKHFTATGVSGAYQQHPELEYAWLQQIRAAGADGIGVFIGAEGLIGSYASYGSKPFAVRAVTPTGNAAVAARTYLTDTLVKRAEKMLELDAIDTQTLRSVTDKAEAVREAIRLYGATDSRVSDALAVLQTAANGVGNANAKAALLSDIAYVRKICNNSRDEAAQQQALKTPTGLTVDGTDLQKISDAFTYTAATDTLIIHNNRAVIGGSLSGVVNIVLDPSVNEMTLSSVTLTAADAYPSVARADGGAVTVKLNGTSTITGAKGMDITPKFIGTGVLMNGSGCVMRKGDVNGSGKVDTQDIRAMLQHVVKADVFDANKLAVADVDGDGRVTSYEARVFLTKVVTQ